MQDNTVFTMNKYAYFPIVCDCCGKIIFLKPYRKMKIKHLYIKALREDNICQTCTNKYLNPLLKKGRK